MYQQIGLDVLKRFDPFALSPLARDRSFYYLLKRALDVTLAALALTLLLPVLLIIAVLIVLDSGWPVIFKQQRVGAERWVRDGYSYWQRTVFICYKFRSMVRTADPKTHQVFAKAFVEGRVEVSNETGPKFKLNGDPRVTRVGRILRKTSLDELPQIVNVLRGEMSLVGPRPDVPYSVKHYKPWHYERLAALPGLTGYWQVKGRCDVPFDEMVRMDIEYIRNQSLWLDLKIILFTIPAVISGRGAG
jgi:lipopolysaccharide/colanic/teichoic acid biosynthesis glycosyltransferase